MHVAVLMKYFLLVIVFLPLIQKGQLSVSFEKYAQVLINRLED